MPRRQRQRQSPRRRRPLPPALTPPKAKPRIRTPTRHVRVRCPACAWEPDGKKYWGCEKCHAIFDTFVTHAHCPKCPNSWTWTECISCHVRSDHEAWYVEEQR